MPDLYGYVGRDAKGVYVTVGQKVGRGRQISCTRIPPGARGSWISSTRCSYQFNVDGVWYAGRGYGEGMSIGLRKMKRPPRGYRARRRR